MPFIENPSAGKYSIKSYKPGDILVNKNHYQHSLILSANQLIPNWRPQNIGDFQSQDLNAIIQLNPEVVILGTGEIQHFIAPALLTRLIERRIGYEIMNTAAACRTFDLLAAEGRNVVAGLILK